MRTTGSILQSSKWLVALLLLGATGTAPAWDGVISADSGAQAGDFHPRAATVPSADGFWALGGNAVAFYALDPALVRFDGAAQAKFARPAAVPWNSVSDAIGTGATSMVALPDGGVLVSLFGSHAMDPPGNRPDELCWLQRYDATGTLRWTRVSAEQISPQITPGCPMPVVAADAAVWIPSSDNARLLRLADDGAMTTYVPIDDGGVDYLSSPTPANTIADANGGVFHAGAGYLAHIGTDGATLWKTSAPMFSAHSRLVLDSAGNLVVAGIDGANLAARSYRSDGSLRWSFTYPDVAPTQLTDIAAGLDERVYVAYVAADPPASAGLLALNDDGTQAWPAPFAASAAAACNPYAGPDAVRVTSTPDGDALFLYAPQDACGADTTLTRLHPDGSVAYSAVLGNRNFFYTTLTPGTLADGSTLLYGARVHHLSATGASLPAPNSTGILTVVPYAIAQALTADASRYILASELDANRQVLTRFAADGTRLWQRRADGDWSSGDVRVSASHDRVCIVGEPFDDDTALEDGLAVQCFAAADGTPVASWAASSDAGRLYAARLLDDDRLVALFSDRHLLLAADGSVLHSTAFAGTGAVAATINANGDTLVATTGTTPGYERVGVDGSIAYTATSFGSVNEVAPVGMALANDGRAAVVLIGSDSVSAATSIYAIGLDPYGALNWRTVLRAYAADTHSTGFNSTGDRVASAAVNFPAPDFGSASVRFDATAVDVAVLFKRTASFVARLDQDSGSLLWDATLPRLETVAGSPRHGSFGGLLADADAARLLLVTDGGNKLRLTTFDGGTGAIVRDRLDACVDDSCQPVFAALLANGNLGVASQPDSGLATALPRVYIDALPFALPPPTRIDQPGLDGAWYAPYESGQGFTFDWIAGANTIFMPWFTFAQSGINEPSGLAWYTLQGSVEAGATSADLVIAVSNPGVFNSGSVPGRQVGTAHLSFSDCNSGTLLYQFDADTNAGAGGLISLTRLTPSTAACVLADGSSTPAQNANAPAHGFDAKQSGSWYDPASAGQGLELTIIPPGNGSAGLVFAPWFTFDPAGAADDPLNQHWLTLQGDLASAAGGKVDFPIYRIIGGSFDAQPTGNYAAVGHATLTMLGCDAARLDYQFDASDLAHAFSGLSGSSRLSRIGGCAP